MFFISPSGRVCRTVIRAACFSILLGTGAVSLSSTAYAQASLRVAVEAKLQIFVTPGISVTADQGNFPVTFQQFTGGGSLTSESRYDNNVSGGGITTGVITGLVTGNGPSPSTAIYNLLFNPSVTLTNNTNAPLDYSFIYNISYGAYVDAEPNGGTATASQSVGIFLNNSVTGAVNNFERSIFTAMGLQTTDPALITQQLTGNLRLFPNQSSTYAFLTRVDGSVQYTPAPPIAAPEPSSLFLFAPAFFGVGLVVRRR